MSKKLKYTEHRTGGEDMVLRIEKTPAQPWEMQEKINEFVDAVNELQKRIDPPSAYEVMREKDEIIARHIGEKNKLQEKLRVAMDTLKEISLRYQNEEDAIEKQWFITARDMCDCADEALDEILKGGKDD